MDNCLTILWRILKLMRNRLVSILSKLLVGSLIYIDLILFIGISNPRIYSSTGRIAWKLLILGSVTLIRKTRCSRQHVGRLVMPLLKWSPVRSTMAWKWISGVVELSCSQWFAGIYPSRIAILPSCTKKYSQVSTYSPASFHNSSKICFRKYWM